MITSKKRIPDNSDIYKAKISCEKSGYNVEDHFPEVGKMALTKRNINQFIKILFIC